MYPYAKYALEVSTESSKNKLTGEIDVADYFTETGWQNLSGLEKYLWLHEEMTNKLNIAILGTFGGH